MNGANKIPIVKIIQDSFIDYEPYQSVVFFVYGCNLKCEYCYNYDYISNKNNIIGYFSEDMLKKYINPLIEAFVWLGGEPLLYDLYDACKIIKKYNLKIKVFTNGMFPKKIEKLLDIVDKFSVDFKTIKFSNVINYDINEYLKRVKKSLEILYNNEKDFEIRITKHKKINEEINDILRELDIYKNKIIFQEVIT